MRHRAFVIGCVLASALSACCSCDPDGHTRAEAGAGAIDCGFAALDEDTTPALACADAAIASGDAFVVGMARLGRDSDVHTYVIGRGDGTFAIFGYDGDPSGGSGACERLTRSECTGAPARTTDPTGRELLSCPSEGEGVTLCGR